MTFNAGQKLPASSLDSMTSRLDALELRVGCILSASSASMTNNAQTQISWTSEHEDPQGFITVPSVTITVPTGYAGIYAIAFKGDFSANLTAARIFGHLAFTGTMTGYFTDWRVSSNSNEDDVWVGCPNIGLNEGATVIATLFHNEGSNQNATAALAMHRISL